MNKKKKKLTGNSYKIFSNIQNQKARIKKEKKNYNFLILYKFNSNLIHPPANFPNEQTDAKAENRFGKPTWETQL